MFQEDWLEEDEEKPQHPSVQRIHHYSVIQEQNFPKINPEQNLSAELSRLEAALTAASVPVFDEMKGFKDNLEKLNLKTVDDLSLGIKQALDKLDATTSTSINTFTEAGSIVVGQLQAFREQVNKKILELREEKAHIESKRCAILDRIMQKHNAVLMTGKCLETQKALSTACGEMVKVIEAQGDYLSSASRKSVADYLAALKTKIDGLGSASKDQLWPGLLSINHELNAVFNPKLVRDQDEVCLQVKRNLVSKLKKALNFTALETELKSICEKYREEFSHCLMDQACKILNREEDSNTSLSKLLLSMTSATFYEYCSSVNSEWKRRAHLYEGLSEPDEISSISLSIPVVTFYAAPTRSSSLRPALSSPSHTELPLVKRNSWMLEVPGLK